ncbi:MAG: OadG family protein [Oscillospiraceae bacterium]|jgi:Na+-transporting methylmalonyl-CoA/oxaloacetate decarboxylase gamma subunit|nr:OadG family protein [Clostridiales bacterium]
MFLINALMEDISVGTAGLVALLGYAVVFIGLIALMVVVMIMGKVMSAKKTAPAAAPAAATAAPAPAPKAAPALATGVAGECKLYNVGDREAAMLMAIVANKLGKPLNTLRFKSMKEVI